jgi:hypothetical protein
MNVDRKVGFGRLDLRELEVLRESRVLLVEMRIAPIVLGL